MRIYIFAWIIAAVGVWTAGCSADFRAGGEHRGVDVGASIGPPPERVYVPPAR